MKRLYVHKLLIVGSILALLGGGVAATFVASSTPRVDESPLRVPVGHAGDQVVYGIFTSSPQAEREWGHYGTRDIGAAVLSGETKSASPYTTLQAAGPRVFEVKSLAPGVYDAAHQKHKAYLVVHNQTWPEMSSVSPQFVEYVDAQVRSVFRREINLLFGESLAADKSDSSGASLNGDDGPEGKQTSMIGNITKSDFGEWESMLPGLTYQGRTLRLGMVLRDVDLPNLARENPSLQRAHEKEWVASRQVINGHDAYGIRLEVTYRFLASSSVDMRMAGASPGQEVEVRTWRVDWMSSDLPYAVLREAGVDFLAGGKTLAGDAYRVAYSLSRFTPGTAGFLAWGGLDGANAHYATVRSDIERSPSDQTHPADGTGSSIIYPLSQAIANVKEDNNLALFRLWLNQNPNALVVSARYTQGGDSGQVTGMWDLLFASSAGRAFDVNTWRTSAGTVDSQEYGSRRSFPSFRESDLPHNLPTIGAIERTWSDYVSDPARQAGFNFLIWGIPRSVSSSCGAPIQSDKGDEFDPAQLTQIKAGHMEGEACYESSLYQNESFVQLNATSALAETIYESRFLYNGGPLVPFTAELRKKWEAKPATVTGGVQSPSATTTTASSAGFLAVFLAAYFWPTLKFAAAKAFLVGGYAKIRKDDVLNNSTRESVLQLIRTVPGIHASDIARQVNAGWGTIVYHLSVLERNKLITSLVDGRHKRFFPSDTIDYSKRTQLAAVMNPTTKQIYELIDGEPGIVQGEIAGRIGITIPTVIWHLQRLEVAGLVGRDKEGRKFHYFANPLYQPKDQAPKPESMEVQ